MREPKNPGSADDQDRTSQHSFAEKDPSSYVTRSNKRRCSGCRLVPVMLTIGEEGRGE